MKNSKPCLAGIAALSLAATIGCSSSGETSAHSEEIITRTTGLWVLEGEPQAGDIELLQLSLRDYATLIRVEEPPVAATTTADVMAPEAAAAVTAHEEPAPPIAEAVGTVRRAWAGHTTISVEGPTSGTFTVRAVGDQLTLTSEDGRVLTYRRSYRLYCVASDRSIEATMLLEMGATPKIVGVNGDGRVFPAVGDYAAKVRTDALVRDKTWIVESKTRGSTITVELPWSDMTRPQIGGTVTISGAADAVTPTAIECERVIDL